MDDAFIPCNYDRFLGDGKSLSAYLKHYELRIAALNHALRHAKAVHRTMDSIVGAAGRFQAPPGC